MNKTPGELYKEQITTDEFGGSTSSEIYARSHKRRAILMLIIAALLFLGIAGIGLYFLNQAGNKDDQGTRNSLNGPRPQVLSNEISLYFRVNTDAIFSETVEIEKELIVNGEAIFNGGISTNNQNIDAGSGIVTAANIPDVFLQTLTAGNGIGITGEANQTITNTGVISLNGSSGAVTLTAGSGISISGTTISSTVAAPSASNSFANIAVSGQSTVTAGSSTDTLTFVEGAGIVLTTSTGSKSVTISSSGAGSQWTTSGTDIYYASGNVGIGTNAPASALDVTGTIRFGSLTNGFLRADGSGNLSVSAVSLNTDVTGVLPVTNGGTGATSLNDLITLGTMTTGNYVAGLTVGNGLAVSGSASEGWIPGLSLDVTTTGTTLTTASNSGLETAADGLSLIRGCQVNEILKWNGTMWQCASDGGGGGGGIDTIQEGGVNIVTSATTINFIGTDFVVTNSGGGVGAIAIDYVASNITRSNQNESISGTWTFGDFTIGGDTFNDLTGTGLQITAGVLETTLGTSVDLTSEVNGMLPIGNGGTGIATTPTSGQLLIGNGTGYSLATLSEGEGIDITNGSGTISIAGEDASDTNKGIASFTTTNFTVSFGAVSITNDSIGDTQLQFNTGQDLTTTSNPTFSTLGLTSLIISGDTINDFSGTGLQVTGNVLSTTLGTSVDLSSEVTGILPLANGGTNANLTAVNGGIIYSTATGMAITSAGLSGQILQSNGAGAPSWVDASSLGTNYWQRVNGNLSPLALNDTISATTSASTALTITQTGGYDVVRFEDQINDSSPFVIDQFGNVGIGISAPLNNPLNIVYNQNNTTRVSFENTSGGSAARTEFFVNTGVSSGGFGVASDTYAATPLFTENTYVYAADGASLVLDTRTATPILFGINDTEQMRLDASGNLGIGITNPSHKLSVNGTGNISGALSLGTSISLGGDTINDFTGTGLQVSGNALQTTLGTSIDLTTEVTGILPLTNGGTNKNLSAVNGGIVWSDADSFEILAAGTAGYVLQSNGAGAPSWVPSSGVGTNYWQQNSGSLAPLTVTNSLVLGGSTTTPFLFEVNGAKTGKALVSFNETGDQNILTASASGATRFNLTNTGNIAFSGNTAFMNTLTSVATGNRTYTLPDTTGTICIVEAGNCAGSGGGITGSGTTNYVSKFTGTGTIGNSSIFDDGNVGIGLTNPVHKFSVSGTANITGALALGTSVTMAGDTIDEFVGTGLQVVSGDLQTTLGTSVDLTSEVTGILPVANGGTGINGSTAANGQLLIGTGTGYSLATLTAGEGIDVTNGSGSITIAGELASDTNLGIASFTTTNFTVSSGAVSITNDSIGDTQLAFNTGQDLTTASSPTFTGLTVSSLTRGLDTITDFTGTGLQMNAGALETTLGTSVSLTTEVTGILPLANGGTNANLTAVNGGVIYSTATGMAITSVGVSGQVLQSTGAGAPTWVDASTLGTNYWQRLNGNLSPLTLNDTLSATTSAATGLTITQTGAFDVVRFEDQASDTTPFLINQVGNVGIGTTSPAALLDVSGTTIIRNTLSQIVSGTPEFTVSANGYLSDGNGNLTIDDSVTMNAGYDYSLAAGTGRFLITGYTGSGNAVDVTVTSTQNNSRGFRIAHTGNISGTGYGVYSTVTGTSTTNIAGYFSATGATNNYAGIFENGNVGIGLTNPTSLLHVAGTATFTGATTISATGTALTISGAATNGLVFSNTGITTDITLQNGETIHNNTDGTITLTTTTLALSGTTTLNGTSLTAFNGGATAIDFAEFDVSATTGSITINDGGDAGNISIEGTILDINTLDFVGVGAITTGGATNLTLDPAGGSVLFNNNDVLNVGGASATAFNFFAGSTAGNTLASGDDDLYIQGELQVDGGLLFNLTGTNDLDINTDSDSHVRLNGLAAGTGNALCIDTGASNRLITCTVGSGGISGSGTVGQIPYFNGTNSITSEATGFAWDSTNKRLGLGTDTPVGKLHVTGANIGKALAIFNETGNQDIFTASASGTTRFVIQNGGNVGIGTTDPTQKLHLGSGNVLLPYSTSSATGNLFFGADTSTSTNGMRLFYNNSLSDGFIDVRSATTTDGLAFRVDTSNGSTERMFITAGGNIGINTVTPTALLDISGSTGASTSGILTFRGTTNPAINFLNGEGLTFNSSVGGGAGLTTRMYIANNGNVGVGAVNDYAKFYVVSNDVVGSGSTYGTFFLNTKTGTKQMTSTDYGTEFSTEFASVDGLYHQTGIGVSSETYMSANSTIDSIYSNFATLSINSSLLGSNGYTATTAAALYGRNYNEGGGRVQNLYGTYSIANTSNSSTTDNQYGLYASSTRSSGTLTTNYGGYFNATGGTTNYGVYSAAGINYFNGNVGIGTTTPSTFQLEIAGSIGPSANDAYDLGSDTRRFRDLYLGPDTLHIGTSTSDEYAISYNTASNYLGFNVNNLGNPEFIMDSAGNLGIGTTATGAKFDVLATSGTQMRLGYDTSNYFTSGISSAGAVTFNAFGASAGFTFNDPMSLGLAGTSNGTLSFLSAGVGITAPTISVDNSGNLTIQAPHSGASLFLGDGTGDINLDAGTDNVVVNLSSTGDFLIQDNGSTFVTFTDAGNVGIGVTNPDAPLSIVKSQSATTALKLTNATNNTNAYAEFEALNDAGAMGSFGIGSSTALGSNGLFNGRAYVFSNSTANGVSLIAGGSGDDIRLFTGGTSNTNERLRIDGNGNVGIGTTAPSAKLHQVGSFTTTTATQFALRLENDFAGTTTADANNYGIYNDVSYSGLDGMVYRSATGNITLMTLASGSTIDSIYGVHGDVYNASSRLATSGYTATTSAAISGFNMTSAGRIQNQYGGVFSSSRIGGTLDNSYGVYADATGGATNNYGIYANVSGGTNNYAGIFTGGNVGIGTTAPSAKLHVSGTSGNTQGLFVQGSTTGFKMYPGSGSPYQGYLEFGDGSGWFFGWGSGANPVAGRLQDNGSVSLTAGSGNFYDGIVTTGQNNQLCYNGSSGMFGSCSSDIRLKKNVRYMDEGGLDIIRQLKPAVFDWIAGGENEPGFIAQDVMAVAPNGVYKSMQDDYYGLRDTAILSYAVQAIKELDRKLSLVDQQGQSNFVSRLQKIEMTMRGDLAVNMNQPEFGAAFIEDLTGGQIKTADLIVTGTMKVNGKSIEDLVSDEVSDALGSQTGSPSADVSDLKTEVASLSAKFATLESLTASTNSLLDQLLNNPMLTGSGSAVLGADIMANSATVSGDLQVLGRTTLADLGITGNITAGVMSLNGLQGAINTIGEPLRLQNMSAAGVDILDGKITIDTSGNLTSEGEITVKKVNIDVLEDEDASVGIGKILTGATKVTIQTTAITDKSKVFITATSDTGDRTLYVLDKNPGIAFTVNVKSAYTKDITFDWWVVN